MAEQSPRTAYPTQEEVKAYAERASRIRSETLSAMLRDLISVWRRPKKARHTTVPAT